jgi:hypothetical protein
MGLNVFLKTLVHAMHNFIGLEGALNSKLIFSRWKQIRVN